MGQYMFTREEVKASRQRRMEKLSPTPEEVELFERLWADYSKNYSQETAWTAPELEGNDALHRRYWEWAQLAKIGPEEDWTQEQEELEYAQEQEAKKKAAEQTAAGKAAEGAP